MGDSRNDITVYWRINVNHQSLLEHHYPSLTDEEMELALKPYLQYTRPDLVSNKKKLIITNDVDNKLKELLGPELYEKINK